MTSPIINFSAPDIGDKALAYLRESLAGGELAGDGPFTRRCTDWLQAEWRSPALLTHSGTAALEMAALLAQLGPGDEVIMPSFTFSSTANAVVLRRATPVFLDIRPDTLNLDEALLDGALSPKTRAVLPVHYAGVACDMDAIMAFAARNNLLVIEDAAQCLLARYHDRPLGTIGALGCFSFHVTKNVVSGEGGALAVNDERFLDRARIIREKGTNRSRFLRGDAQKYDWRDVGSSFLLSDVLAALLLSQLEDCRRITDRRLELWHRYHAGLAAAESCGRLRRPAPPDYARHNGHIYFIVMPDAAATARLRIKMAEAGIPCPPHYVPLHSAPAGGKFGRVASAMTVTDHAAGAMLRLPLHSRISDADADRVVDTLVAFLE